ncbi:MAG TPA: spondin domain-containing protein [Pyrinomonadaceae bacterium]|nr:spondin domain-containing protein [Pyrinomonadaceae bacterium]
MKHRRLLIGLALLVSALAAQLPVAMATRRPKTTKFSVRIENISSADGQTAADGSKWPFALSPGMFVLDKKNGVLFSEGKPVRRNGLEAQAEDGNPSGLIGSLERMHHAAGLHGVYNTPVGAMGPGPIGPAGSYKFSFEAAPGVKLFVAFMFGQSNDLFYAPDTTGIALFDTKGSPISGDVTEKLILWDAGTEVDEELGVGANQAPRQKAANTGAEERGTVRRAQEVRFYGKNEELFRVTIAAENGM